VLRGGLIGLGNVAVHGHVPGWRARRDVAIVAVTDVRPAARATAAVELPGARWYDSPAELVAAGGLDFVDICTPPTTHAALVVQALAAGLHVLCEKPLVCSTEDFIRLAGHAAAADRVLYTVHNWHHAPIAARADALLRDGAIGRLHHVAWETIRVRPASAGDGAAGNWRVDPAIGCGGVLTDHGWHVFYVLRRWIGADATAVSATLERRRHREWAVEDTATVDVTFPGATASVFLTWAGDTRRTRAELRGSDGTLVLDDDALILKSAKDERRWACPPGLSDGSHHADWFHGVAERFVRALADDGERRANLAEARLCVTLESAARASSRCGRPLPVVVEGAASRGAC
jgi:predicted dehydrogenase